MLPRTSLLASLTVALLAATPALASGGTVMPTAAQRNAIVHAFGDPASAVPCLNVGLARSDHAYATVRFRDKQSCLRWAFNGTNVLVRGTGGHWEVAFEGSSYHCPLPKIPRQVQRDLGVCP
jgi:hypothetical protein